ncbi:MAG: sulfite exporter TauE/SafE family protein, partial [Candidatus Eremiobacterota bacterium]
MEFAIAGVEIAAWKLVLLGFVIGVMGGFFGVGGSFIAGPAMFSLGIPMNFVVGTDLAHIAGKSVVAAKKHRAMGNVDLKLGWLMVVGTVLGVEVGAQLIQLLKQTHQVDQVVAIAFLCILVCISLGVGIESFRTLRSRGPTHEDPASRYRLARWVQRLNLGPSVSLPTSGIARISILTVVLVGLIGGFFSGFLG